MWMFFIGSRSVPGVYGLTKAYAVENDGKETLQTILKKVAFKPNDVGMVTDAV
jgi:hypothetical protein